MFLFIVSFLQPIMPVALLLCSIDTRNKLLQMQMQKIKLIL